MMAKVSALASAMGVVPNVQSLMNEQCIGVVYGILLTTALLQCALFIVTRDRTIIFFLFALALRFMLELARVGPSQWQYLGSSSTGAALLELVAATAEYAFAFAYLRVAEAPRLKVRFIAAFTLVIAGGLASLAIPALAPISETIRHCSRLAALLIGLSIIVARLRSGFTPAAYFLVAFTGVLIGDLYNALVDAGFTIIPAVDPFAFELSTVFPALVFTVGIPFRARFVLNERETLERDLREAEYAAEHDPLTGILNRRGLDAWTVSRSLAGTSVLFIDLDRFKSVNDLAGHDAGDRILIAVASVLSSAVRDMDAVARVGGDEFVVILGRRGGSAARAIARRISNGVDALVPPLGAPAIGASIGIAAVEAADSLESALARADADAYRVKAERRVITSGPALGDR